MPKFLTLVLFLLNSFFLFAQQNTISSFEKELKYGSPDDTSLPLWVREMYKKDPNLFEVERLKEEYYKNNEFVKNSHTQYYKRWKKHIGQFVNEQGFIRPPSKEVYDREMNAYMMRKAEAAIQNQADRSVAGSWTCIGPFDFDKDAAGRSHAPGAAHVYTLEKSKSNSNILFAGTANAGVWKTIDNGANWTCVTRGLAFNYCNAVEIHPTDPNIVWIGANDRLYKSIDGGANWTTAGNAAFNALSHSIDDIALMPNNPNTLFVCSDKGLYRSTDGGANFTQAIEDEGADAYFSEIEFKPNDPNTVYVVQSGVADKYTEFYKSTDGGLTFSIMNSWPVIASSSSQNYNYINRTATNNSYASFSNDNLGTSTNPNFTLEIRMKIPNSIADQAILANKNWSSGSNNGWTLAARYTGQLMFNMGTGSSRIELLTSGIWDNNWHHVTVVWRNTGSKELYVDGVLKHTITTNMTSTNTNLPMILGRDGALQYGAFDMDIDDIRIWNTALSAATVASNATTDITAAHANYANLLHYYKCNSIAGNTLTDERGTNNGTLTNTWTTGINQSFSSTTTLTGTNEQKRAEIAVTAAMPNRVYALLAGAANGGSGLYGFYVSDDAGATWSHKCCGTGPGGNAVATTITGVTTPTTNANILGYSETGGENGGQYYYDLAMDADPANGNKVHIGGINHWYSVDGGTTFNLTAKWSWPDDPEYVHADIHGIHIYGNEVWINNDGGIFMSQDSGKTNFNRRQFGIAGTDFWGFGMGHKDGDVMLGGTYHNSHLMKNNNVYLNGWVSYTGSADGTRGFVNPGKPKLVYNDSRRDVLPNNRTISPTALTLSKLPNTNPESKIAFDPRCYNCIYTGTGADLWYSEDDGVNWTLKYNFGTQNVADIEIAWDDPNIIFVTTAAGFYDPKQIWKSIDRGISWTNITPSNTALGYSSAMWFDLALGTNSQDVWMIAEHPYGWFQENIHKVFYSSNGGTTWTDWTTTLIANEAADEILYQRGTNGGIYLGTRRSVFYRNKSMTDWVQFDTGLPPITASTRLAPWYKEGKLRNATNQSVWETPFYEIGQPHAQPMVDKFVSNCQRDTFYFADYSAHNSGATWNWQFSPTPAYVSSTTVENPKVVFGAAGTYNVTLTVTDNYGTSTKNLIGGVQVNTGCAVDSIPGNALQQTVLYQYAEANSALNISSNTFTMMAWIKPSEIHADVAPVIFGVDAGGSVTGINLTTNNALRYHYSGTSNWSFNSNLTPPANEWSHVALVVTPTSGTLYMNGKAATKTSTHAARDFAGALRIGGQQNWTSRTFKGEIDEVAFYNRSLSQNEIREQMHLAKKPTTDPTLLAYYQFNENSGSIVYDRVNLRHLTLTGGNTRTVSTAPVGSGVAERQTLSSSGLKNYSIPKVSMTFNTGTYPNGEVTTTRLNIAPDSVLSNQNALNNRYWIFNNNGTNLTFTGVINSLTFSGLNVINATASNYKLYKRATNEYRNNWTLVDTADAVTTGANGSITFNVGLNINNLGQFAIFEGQGISLAAKAILEGAFDNTTGKMSNYYGSSNLLPTAQPYSNFTHLGSGGETTASTILTANAGDNSIVDWIFLELRDKNNASNRLYTRVGLLQKDGDIVDMDGVSPITFSSATADNYYIAVRHRNHLGFRTANTVALSNVPMVLNFTNNTIALNGSTPTTLVATNTYAMVSGDANKDGSIDAFDTIDWEAQNGLFDNYLLNADYNLDGSVDAFDSILWELNNGKFEELD